MSDGFKLYEYDQRMALAEVIVGKKDAEDGSYALRDISKPEAVEWMLDALGQEVLF